MRHYVRLFSLVVFVLAVSASAQSITSSNHRFVAAVDNNGRALTMESRIEKFEDELPVEPKPRTRCFYMEEGVRWVSGEERPGYSIVLRCGGSVLPTSDSMKVYSNNTYIGEVFPEVAFTPSVGADGAKLVTTGYGMSKTISFTKTGIFNLRVSHGESESRISNIRISPLVYRTHGKFICRAPGDRMAMPLDVLRFEKDPISEPEIKVSGKRLEPLAILNEGDYQPGIQRLWVLMSKEEYKSLLPLRPEGEWGGPGDSLIVANEGNFTATGFITLPEVESAYFCPAGLFATDRVDNSHIQ